MKSRNALFSFTPGFMTGRQRRSRSRTPYNRRYARALRKARKHRYDWIPEGGVSPAPKKKAMSATQHDVFLALRGQGYTAADAKKAARSASGSDFSSIFRSALYRVRGNPMSKKKKSRKKRNKMPSGLKKYWAKMKRMANKRKSKRNSRRRRKSNPRVRTRTIVRTVKKIVYRNKRRKKRAAKRNPPRPRVNRIKIPGTLTKAQARAITRGIARATGRRAVNIHGRKK